MFVGACEMQEATASVTTSGAREGAPPGPAKPDWYPAVAAFARPDTRRATWQLIETLVPYAAVWIAMAWLVPRRPLAALGLTVLAAGLIVRVFILFHDCCHHSLFPSARANRIVGYLTGLLTLTPFELWQHAHVQHHATVGDLDRRGVGDVWTLTVGEYLAASRLQRLFYRVFRNPLVMFGVGPVFVFVVQQRFCPRHASRRERFSVRFTNVGAAALVVAAVAALGFWNFALLVAPVGLIGGAAGIWLFYVQHQFDDVYWSRHDTWDPWRAALSGSSYYKLPKVLQWFTGSIGLHHIHHLQPRIPSYSLQRCQNAVPALQDVPPLTIRGSLRTARLRLWDEAHQRMVRFTDLRAGDTPSTGTAVN
jgi:acyl-lipid omega-6 desaturase (Delta-12 desaturase)